MIDYEKSAELNNCTIEELKIRFEKFPNSNKLIIRVCDNCHRERKIKFQCYSDLCQKCVNKTSEARESARLKSLEELTQKYVRSLFDYRDGGLYWKVKKANWINIGDQAGVIRCDDYRSIGINGKYYLAHRLIFLYHNGYLPKFLDHIDGNPSNNDISNLREATHQENIWNQKKTKSINGKPTSSEYKGVTWDKRAKKWASQITIDGKGEFLGHFISEIKAAKAYDKAAIKLFGKFKQLNGV